MNYGYREIRKKKKTGKGCLFRKREEAGRGDDKKYSLLNVAQRKSLEKGAVFLFVCLLSYF